MAFHQFHGRFSRSIVFRHVFELRIDDTVIRRSGPASSLLGRARLLCIEPFGHFGRGIAGLAEVSDVALLKRLRKSENWFLRLCQALLAETGINPPAT